MAEEGSRDGGKAVSAKNINRMLFGDKCEWWYLSFATDDGFRGAFIVEAIDILSAVGRVNQLGQNPGGQVMGVPLPEEELAKVPESYRERFLTKEDLQACWPEAKTFREWEQS